jgi:dTDP-4-amino-4,6-dideoxygalactose transaminase
MHLYTLLIDRDRCGISRDRFLQEMTQRNIGVGVHYLSIADHPFYQRAFGWRPEQVPNATRIGRQTVSLPLGPKLSDGDVADVIGAVRACLDSN